MKSDHHNHHRWLPGWYSGWLFLQLVSMHGNSVDIYFVRVNIMIDSMKRTRQDIDLTTFCDQRCETAKCSSRGSPCHQGIVGWAQYMLPATLYSCWSLVNTMTSCLACFVNLSAVHVYGPSYHKTISGATIHKFREIDHNINDFLFYLVWLEFMLLTWPWNIN